MFLLLPCPMKNQDAWDNPVSKPKTCMLNVVEMTLVHKDLSFTAPHSSGQTGDPLVYDDGVNISEDTDPGEGEKHMGKPFISAYQVIHYNIHNIRPSGFLYTTMAIFQSVAVVSSCVQSTPRQGKEVGELTEGIANLAKRHLDCTWLTSRDVVVVLSILCKVG